MWRNEQVLDVHLPIRSVRHASARDVLFGVAAVALPTLGLIAVANAASPASFIGRHSLGIIGLGPLTGIVLILLVFLVRRRCWLQRVKLHLSGDNASDQVAAACAAALECLGTDPSTGQSDLGFKHLLELENLLGTRVPRFWRVNLARSDHIEALLSGTIARSSFRATIAAGPQSPEAKREFVLFVVVIPLITFLILALSGLPTWAVLGCAIGASVLAYGVVALAPRSRSLAGWWITSSSQGAQIVKLSPSGAVMREIELDPENSLIVVMKYSAVMKFVPSSMEPQPWSVALVLRRDWPRQFHLPA